MNTSRRLFGDPARFAMELALMPDPDIDQYASVDEVGSFGYFNMYIAGRSPFCYRLYDMVDDPSVLAGYRILDTYKEFDDGRTDHLAPIVCWLHYVFETITLESKSRFERMALVRSPFGTWGNIYPDIAIKRSSDEVIVEAVPDATVTRATGRKRFYFKRHIEYMVAARCKLPVAEFVPILRDTLIAFYDDPLVVQAREKMRAKDWTMEYDKFDHAKLRFTN